LGKKGRHFLGLTGAQLKFLITQFLGARGNSPYSKGHRGGRRFSTRGQGGPFFLFLKKAFSNGISRWKKDYFGEREGISPELTGAQTKSLLNLNFWGQGTFLIPKANQGEGRLFQKGARRLFSIFL